MLLSSRPSPPCLVHFLSVLLGPRGKKNAGDSWGARSKLGPIGSGWGGGDSEQSPGLNYQHFQSYTSFPQPGGEAITAAGCAGTFGAGDGLCVFSLGNCVTRPYSSCNTCFTRALVLSDTIWNNICHPLSGVIYSLARRETSAVP